MKIEMVEFAPDEAMHMQHTEIGVRAETEDPLGPGDWHLVWSALSREQRVVLGDACKVAMTSSHSSGVGRPCKFFVDAEHESEPENNTYAQWWFFPKI